MTEEFCSERGDRNVEGSLDNRQSFCRIAVGDLVLRIESPGIEAVLCII
jgi:hypothetical protein